MIEHTRSVSEVIAEAVAPLIADRLEEGVRSVFEGDFIQPSFAASSAFDGIAADGRVRSVFLLEAEEQLAANIAGREGEEQPRRARISWNYGEWIRAECDRYGLPAIPASPRETAVDRALTAVSGRRR
jgi:hypothetical protein